MDRRTLLALSLSFALLMIYQTYMEIYFPAPPISATEPIDAQSAHTKAPLVTVGKGGEELALVVKTPQPPTEPLLNETVNNTLLNFENSYVHGSVSLTGAQLVDLDFLQHLDELLPKGQPIHFLHKSIDSKNPDSFFGESGFLATTDIKTPGRKTVWNSANQETVHGGGSIDMVWDNGVGQRFEKSFILSPKSYQFIIRDRIINNADHAIPVYHFAQFVRTEPIADVGQTLAVADFQGPMGYLDKVRLTHTYESLRSKDQHLDASSGWAGFSDKYFLAALIPADKQSVKKFYFDHDLPTYRIGTVAPQSVVAPGTEVSFETHLFIGPKEIRKLEAQNVGLERAIDYGWFHFLAVPLVDLMLFLNDYLHNFGLAIIFLTILVKALFYPLANKSYYSMNAMKKLQPKIEELRKLHGSDKTRLNQEMMQLYQNNKVNPLGGCLPIVVQIPVFFALYQVLYLSVEIRHAPFYFWIHDLSIMDPYYVLPLLMGASMFIQARLNPPPADPIQAKVMLFLPIVFTFMFLSFPSGLVLYWLVNNVLSIAQQGYIMKKMG